MNLSFINHKKSLFLVTFYFFAIIFGLLVFEDYGIHIEEKFHRLNGHYWLNYIAKILYLDELNLITNSKISSIYDYTLSRVSHYDKWGPIFDTIVAYLEILLKLEDINQIYYFKHFLSYLFFLIGSFFFFKILEYRFQNFYLSFFGLILYLTSPRIFGDSFLYKDVLYLSFFSITIYFFVKSLEKLDNLNLFFFSIFTAISFNLRIFTILIPFLFFLILVIKNFYKKENLYFFKKFCFYCLSFIIFTFLTWPYLWSDPFNNFLNLFTAVKNDLVDIRILFFNEYVQNTLLPTKYILIWIFISSPLLLNIIFVPGFFFCLIRVVRRLLSVKEESLFNDLWRGSKEKVDFIIFIIFFSYFLFFMIFNAPFYNGWRLVYFFNYFIIYFGIYFLNYVIIFNKRKKKLKTIIFFSIFFFLSTITNIYNLYSFHPFQSIYFNNFLSEKTINGFEGDYYGLSGKHFFNEIIKIDKKNNIKIAVASHTPLQRSLEALPSNLQKRFSIIGQDYSNADYIYKNNISEVNIKLNKKYQIPKNFSKIRDFKIKKILVYEIFKKNN